MSLVFLITRRELGAYVRSPLGSVVLSAALLLNGLLFYVFGFSEEINSGEMLARYFYYSSGVTMVAALFLSFRLIAEERQTKTFTLLNTSPVSDAQIVVGKFLSALCMVSVLTLLSLYMPALIYVSGKVSLGHIAVGYLGLLLVGGATCALGLFASTLTRSQVIAVIAGAVILGTLLVLWTLASKVSPPVSDFVGAMSFHHLNFRGFQHGILELRGVAYYLVMTYLFLLGATKVLEARRWR